MELNLKSRRQNDVQKSSVFSQVLAFSRKPVFFYYQTKKTFLSEWKKEKVLPAIFFVLFAIVAGSLVGKPIIWMLVYPIAAISVFSGIEIFFHKRDFTAAKKISYAIAISLSLFLLGKYDRYETTWKDGNTEFTDTFTRWGNNHFYRRVTFSDEQGHWTGWSSGHVAGSGKLHGEWSFTTFKPSWTNELKWFWYGDEISEGEWHLRNR